MVSSRQVWATVRLADDNDMPQIHRMIRQLAETQRLAGIFSATESSLSSIFFPKDHPRPPFQSFTVLLLEVSPQQPQEEEAPLVVLLQNEPDQEPPTTFTPVTRRFDLASPVSDAETEAFASARGNGGVVAGFVHFFPSFSTFLAKPGFHVEDLFVRAAYRGRGFGRMLLSAVATQAARMGMGRVEWCVLDWNAKAIKFYEEMGAEVQPEWRICRLAGDALLEYCHEEEAADMSRRR